MLYTPFLKALEFFYNTIAFHDLGFSIIALTLAIRFLMLPVFYRSARNQAVMQRLQPHIEKIQKDHKDNKENQTKAMLELYKTHDVNPLSIFFVIIIQLVVFVALYKVFSTGINSIPDKTFLKMIDLTKVNYAIAALALAAQYFQGYVALPKTEPGKELSSSERMAKNMVYIGPLIMITFLFRYPAAIGLYWLVNGIFGILQQVYINKSIKNVQLNPQQ